MLHPEIHITKTFKLLQQNGKNINLFRPKRVLFFLHFA
jgi:hypothetical protein